MVSGFGLTVQVCVEVPSGERLAEVGLEWVRLWVEGLGDAPWSPFGEPEGPWSLDPWAGLGEPPPPPVGVPREVDAEVEVAWNHGDRAGRSASRRYSRSSVGWLEKQLLGLPSVVYVHLSWRGGSAEMASGGTIVKLACWVDSPGWVQLTCGVPEAAFLDPEGGPATQRRWLGLLRGFAESADPGFGQVGHSRTFGATDLETALSAAYPRMSVEHRDPMYTVGTCRSKLRGYGWVTVLPDELVARLGGVGALAGSGAFCEVAALAGGGVWAQATQDYRDYGPEQVERVFGAVAPVLLGGIPGDYRLEETAPYRVVLADAAVVSGRPEDSPPLLAPPEPWDAARSPEKVSTAKDWPGVLLLGAQGHGLHRPGAGLRPPPGGPAEPTPGNGAPPYREPSRTLFLVAAASVPLEADPVEAAQVLADAVTGLEWPAAASIGYARGSVGPSLTDELNTMQERLPSKGRSVNYWIALHTPDRPGRPKPAALAAAAHRAMATALHHTYDLDPATGPGLVSVPRRKFEIGYRTADAWTATRLPDESTDN